MQEPRRTSDEYAYLSRVVLENNEMEKVGTLSKKQRELINDGIDTISAQDDCVRTCLKARSPVRSSFLGRFTKVLLLLPCLLAEDQLGVVSQQVTPTAEYRQEENSIDRICPDLIIGCEDSQCEPTQGYYQKLEAASEEGKCVLHFSRYDGQEDKIKGIPWYYGRGNIKFACNDPDLAEQVKDWTDGTRKYEPQVSIKDLQNKEMI